MKLDAQRIVIGVAAVAAGALLVWALATPSDNGEVDGQQPDPPHTNGVSQPSPPHREPNGDNGHEQPAAFAPFEVDPLTTTWLPRDIAEAVKAYEQGLQALQADELLKARRLLSAALLSGHLNADRTEDARAKATDLASRTILSSRVITDDPYTYRYAVQPNDMLIQVERREELKIPTQLIERVNRIQANRIQAGQSLKFVRGPFHAIVSKRTMTMDVYLYRPGVYPVYICRLPVGLGRDNGTPVGLWRIHGKDEQPIWYPPPGSSRTQPVRYGQAGYPFGAKGLWIRLEGMDESNEGLTRYGIHSTADPSSIGRSESLGCIRLGDDDIELIYGTLYQTWSTVLVTD